MDDDLKLAGIWNEEIADRIANCDLFLLLLSRATQAADENRFFKREWALAHAGQRRLFPVRLEPCELPASLPDTLRAAIRGHQRQDLYPSYEDGLRRILQFLHAEKRIGAFEETFSCLGPDNPGWRLNGWWLDSADSTGGNSASIRALARLSPAQLLPQSTRRTAAIDIELPTRPVLLRYRRILRMSAPISGEATFRVSVDGELVDAVSQADPTEDGWTTGSVPIPDRGARPARLELTVAVSSSMNYLPSAEVWIDDLRIG